MSIAIFNGLAGKLKTLVDRLTAVRAANLDNADTPVSTRAPAATALLNTIWTDARAALLENLANIANPPERIKSRAHHQHTATGTGALTSIFDSIDASQSKVRVIYLGCWAPSGGTCSGGVYFSGTAVVCQGNTSSSGMTWSFIIEEYY